MLFNIFNGHIKHFHLIFFIKNYTPRKIHKQCICVFSRKKTNKTKPKFTWRIYGRCVHVWSSECSVSEHPDTEYSRARVCPIFTLLKWDRRTERWQRTRERKSAALSELSPAPLAKRPWPQPYPLQGRRGDIRAETDMVIGGERETENKRNKRMVVKDRQIDKQVKAAFIYPEICVFRSFAQVRWLE